MRQSLLIISIIVGLLIFGFQNCSKGTDTGNPKTGASYTDTGSIGTDQPFPGNHNLGLAICSVLIRCQVNIDESTCLTQVNNTEGVAVLFGAAAASTLLKDLAVADSSSAELSSCKTKLQELQCADLTLGDPFANLDKLVPPSCSNVFVGQ